MKCFMNEEDRLQHVVERLSEELDDLKSQCRYPHMCRDGHEEIGHRDSENEMFPLCRANARAEEVSKATIEYLKRRRIVSRNWLGAKDKDIKKMDAAERNLRKILGIY
jgi:hypothetical protein